MLEVVQKSKEEQRKEEQRKEEQQHEKNNLSLSFISL